MSDSVIFPTEIPNGIPVGSDRFIFSDTSDANATKDAELKDLPISDATATAIASVQSDIDTHEARTDNPHSVTKSQVGLSNVDNTSDVNKPISTATQAALNTKVDNVVAGTNTTVSRVGNTITVNSLGGPAVITDGFNRNYFVATAGQTEFTSTFDFTENTGSVLVTLNGLLQIPTTDYTEDGANKITFLHSLDEGALVQMFTGVKGEQGIPGTDGTDGTDGIGVVSITLTSGDHSPGTLDTYTITYTDATTSTFTVYNGADGIGGGDMLKAVYDTNNNGIVDNSEALGGENGSYYLNRANHTGTQKFNTISEISFDLPVTIGQSLVYDGTNWTNSNPTPAVGSANTFYLDATSTIADNLYLNTSPSSFPQTIKNSSVDADINGGIGFIERFVSGPLGRTDIPAGNWTFNTYASTSNNIGTDTIQIRVNKRVEMSGMTGTFTGTGPTRTFTVTGGTPFVPGDAGTILTSSLIETPNQTAWISSYVSSSQVIVTLTDSGYVNETNVPLNGLYYLLFNSGETTDITGTSPINYTKTTTQPAFVVNPTNRIVVAYFAKTTSGIARTISLYYGGTTAYSNIVSPLTTDHGDLGGLEHDDHTQYQLTCSNQFAITDYTFTGSETRNSGYLVNTSASDRTVNLNADLFSTGFEVSICKGTNDTNTVTIDAGTGNTINGTQTYVLTQYNEFVTLLKYGADTWKIKSKYEGENVVFTTDTQTITNKTLDDEIRAKQIATPTNPTAGYNKLYFKSDDKLYKLTSGGVETEVGGGGAGLTWGASISGTSGTGLTTTISNSASAGTIGQSIVAGNTQTNAITLLNINTGTSTSANKTGIDIIHLAGTANSFKSLGAITINSFASPTEAVNNVNGISMGTGFNTNSSYNNNNIYIANRNNTGTGLNTGINILQYSTELNTTFTNSGFGLGAGLKIQTSGSGGTAIAIGGGDNVNSSTNGLVNYTLSNTQSGATVMQKIDTGTSAQGHTGLLINAFGASTFQRGITINTSSTGTGIPIELITSGTGRKAIKLSTGFTTSTAPTGASTYIIIDINGTEYKLLAQASA